MSPADRMKAAIAALIRELLPQVPYLGRYEYRVQKAEGGKFSGRPTSSALGLPELADVPMRPSITGGTGKLPPGSRVEVMFTNGDPARPVVVGGDDAADPLEVALRADTKITADAAAIILNGGAQGVARMGDAVIAGPFPGTITSGSATVKAG